MLSKNYVAVIVILSLVFMLFIPGYAYEEENKGYCMLKDIDSSYWAYEAIQYMVAKGIINGYEDGTFKPDNPVTRAEFAKMMVLALNIDLIKPETGTFLDLAKSHWSYKYVESAKFYLTGFRVSSGDYFKPDFFAVREDMAVALVKALGYSNENAEADMLDMFSDIGDISLNLRKYVSIAVQKGIMEGYPEQNDGKKKFGAQNNLTRAEAAQLLYRTLKKDENEEKVTYDEEKITHDNNNAGEENGTGNSEYEAPNLSCQIEDGKIYLTWDVISHAKLSGYKVVISLNNPNPEYPKDGYLAWITDKNKAYYTVSAQNSYNGGDFGGKVLSGQTYYFSITAVYTDKKVAGNVIQITVP